MATPCGILAKIFVLSSTHTFSRGCRPLALPRSAESLTFILWWCSPHLRRGSSSRRGAVPSGRGPRQHQGPGRAPRGPRAAARAARAARAAVRSCRTRTRNRTALWLRVGDVRFRVTGKRLGICKSETNNPIIRHVDDRPWNKTVGWLVGCWMKTC